MLQCLCRLAVSQQCPLRPNASLGRSLKPRADRAVAVAWPTPSGGVAAAPTPSPRLPLLLVRGGGVQDPRANLPRDVQNRLGMNGEAATKSRWIGLEVLLSFFPPSEPAFSIRAASAPRQAAASALLQPSRPPGGSIASARAFRTHPAVLTGPLPGGIWRLVGKKATYERVCFARAAAVRCSVCKCNGAAQLVQWNIKHTRTLRALPLAHLLWLIKP